MGILKVNDLSKSFGIEELFHGVSFEVTRGDKVGFVGANGAGKSTLMRCLMGLDEYDGGHIQFDTADTVGYLEQETSFGDWPLYEELRQSFSDILHLAEEKAKLESKIEQAADDAVMESLMEEYSKIVDQFERLDGYDYESRIRRIAYGLGFTDEDFKKNVGHFSGGQKTRICLAKALLREPDFLFLDEPTNHLDIEMIEWLEDFLKSYKGGVLLISHDRFFLDRVATRIIELENKTVIDYTGNYTRFTRVKEDRRAALESAYEKQQVHIKNTEEYIRKYKAGIKSKQARGREKQLNRLERILLPPNSIGFNYFSFNPPAECAQRVAELEEVSMTFGQQDIFKKLSLLIRNGDGVALVGPNGAGKTTLLRLLIGELESPTGRVKIGSRVKIGYYSQQHEGLNEANRLIDELLFEYGITEEQARRYLGSFLFYGDDVYKIIGSLSGGEKSRLAFLKLMLTGANFLILDEPTNHLDIPAKEAVEEALMAFPGTFITVSHDRYFLDKVTNCTCELSAGILTEYNGNYSYYHEKKLFAAKEASEIAAELAAENAARQARAKKTMKAEEVSSSAAFAKNNKAAKNNRPQVMSTDKRNDLIQRCEAEIAMLEMELKGLDYQMNDAAVQADPLKSQEIANAYTKKEAELTMKYDVWSGLTSEE
ncbi:ATP-binding cassette, subfamily F, member 3 [Propionispira arboris]|uniref:ATP-binding cassette, subfamily F, member 3 n=1 Tax=Propionispira arboris TaxID=84035 RepID=A0A1H7CFQ5_9FIRM|nr:ABC-F family ATP-binding cassette domain-containing protein [Propionispira arboris]SEJ88306.1 ATP-binding cassette, subfamily F, member 3 [Propionispira arboris]